MWIKKKNILRNMNYRISNYSNTGADYEKYLIKNQG